MSDEKFETYASLFAVLIIAAAFWAAYTIHLIHP